MDDIPTKAVDVDLLLGELEYVGKGIGPAALAVLAKDLRDNTAVPLIGLTSAVGNTRAHRAFAKAGL